MERQNLRPLPICGNRLANMLRSIGTIPLIAAFLIFSAAWAYPIDSNSQEITRELATSESSANAAWSSAKAAWLSVFLSFLAVGGVFMTFIETRKTTNAALGALNEARRANSLAENDARPWLSIDDVISESQGDWMGLELTITNLGKSPAMNVVVNCREILSAGEVRPGQVWDVDGALALIYADFQEQEKVPREEKPAGFVIFPGQSIAVKRGFSFVTLAAETGSRHFTACAVAVRYDATGKTGETSAGFGLIDHTEMSAAVGYDNLIREQGSYRMLRLPNFERIT